VGIRSALEELCIEDRFPASLERVKIALDVLAGELGIRRRTRI
jgi:hypothetical protein